jgi:hypothetical protein
MPTQPGSHYREDSLPTSPDFTGSVVGSISRNRRSFAALAQKTTVALGLQNSSLRSSTSYSSLSKSTPLTPPLDDTYEQLTGSSRPCSPALADSTTSLKRRFTLQRLPTPPQESRSDPPGGSPKMHQTSSRLLRMTEDERPFTKVGQGRGIAI